MLLEYLNVACLIIDCVLVYGGIYDGVSLPIIDEVVFYSTVWFVLDVFVIHLVVDIGYGFGLLGRFWGCFFCIYRGDVKC